MEAYSVEDSGKGIQFCKYCYNVQPGVAIDYATGDSKETGTSTTVDHTPDCSAVSKISSKNKAYSDKSVSELESEGYTPCKMCNPQ